jgi:PTS system fructose-specific IIC component
MNIKNLLKEDSIILNKHCLTKEEVIDTLVECHYQTGHIKDKKIYKEAILEREKLSSTGVGNMIAIPHAQNETVNYPSLVAMVDKEGVDFQSLDQQPAKIFFMIAVPKEGGSQHLEILAQLCQILMEEKIVKQLLNALTPKEFIDILTGEIGKSVDEKENKDFEILAVTACPTGIAHTYMAAKALEDTAKQLGIRIKVETNGASGVKNKLTEEEISAAKCIIVAADKKVDINRFKNKRMIQVPVAKGIYNSKELLEEAMSEEKEGVTHLSKNKFEIKPIKAIYKHLMNGVSQIIPILMIYGIVSTFLSWFSTSDVGTFYTGTMGSYSNSYLNYLSLISTILLTTFIIPLFSAFIADSIGDKPAFVVALVSSIVTLSIFNDEIRILLAILIAFGSGYLVLGLKKLFSYLPKDIETIIPNLLLPLCGTAIMIFIVIVVLQNGENILIRNQTSMIPLVTNEIVLAIIGFVIGVMMSIDMGGPINKTAYLIGIIGIFLGRYTAMSAAMIGGMIPPMAIGLASLIYPSIFTEEERKGKWKCIIKGLCFVSEEAIPYMIKDRKGIHIPCIIASGIGSALSMYFACSQMFPHGGIFTVIFINHSLEFLISLLAATLIGASLIILFKKTSN